MNWELVTNVVWAILLCLVVGVEFVAQWSRRLVVTLDEAIRASVSRAGIRGVIVLGWMWLGWHAFAR